MREVTNTARPALRVAARLRLGQVRGYIRHPDPLAEMANWVAVIIGTHLPFWPLYVLWCAGLPSLPTSLLTMSMSPVFLAIPALSRRNSLLGRMAMVAAGLANTVLTVWVLGLASGSYLFLGPSAALAALLFRRGERWFMVGWALLPLGIWYLLQNEAPPALHHYGPKAIRSLMELNIISVSVLIALFGWLQTDTYRRMERP